jgi:hypothetical protein
MLATAGRPASESWPSHPAAFRLDLGGAEWKIIVRADAFIVFNQDNYGIPALTPKDERCGRRERDLPYHRGVARLVNRQ